ncbi:uncharacterized protein LOC141857498 [Brevipalpus obovatus]|uniref:uncharacterized protein LOC141857498 n=1 Tax=Brevipalpus obovatus TaxID=246614 RepID=UPI003D9E7DA0
MAKNYKNHCWKCSSSEETNDFSCKKCKQNFHYNCNPGPEQQIVDIPKGEPLDYCKECVLKEKSKTKANRSKKCSEKQFGKSFEDALKRVVESKQEEWTKKGILSASARKCCYPGALLHEVKKQMHAQAIESIEISGNLEEFDNHKILKKSKHEPESHEISKNSKKEPDDHKILKELKNELESIEQCVWSCHD